jgi:CheY-like chemotaxis protein
MRVLFADDMQDTVLLYRTILELNHCAVEVAYNGEEAVQVARQAAEPFDAIILDVEMPRMNGWQAARAIRELPWGQGAFMMMFTAYGDSESLLRQVGEVGADALYNKPMMHHELIRRLREGVAQRISQGT